jgi:hypothetical protein
MTYYPGFGFDTTDVWQVLVRSCEACVPGARTNNFRNPDISVFFKSDVFLHVLALGHLLRLHVLGLGHARKHQIATELAELALFLELCMPCIIAMLSNGD